MDRNFITAAMMEMISEAHVFAEKTGLGSGNLEVLIRENYGELAYTSEQFFLPSSSTLPRIFALPCPIVDFPNTIPRLFKRRHNTNTILPLVSKRLTTGAYCPPKGERPWSDLGLAIKDVRIGISCAEKAGTRLKVAEVALGHLVEAKGWAEEEEEGVGRMLDSSSMFGVIRRDAGLGFETDGVKERDA